MHREIKPLHIAMVLATILLGVQSCSPRANLKAAGLTVKQLRSDYRLACLAIAESYVGLEEKTGMDPSAFLEAGKRREEGIGRRVGAGASEDFIEALRSLRAEFPDGHFDWSLGPRLGRPSSMNLGLIITMMGDTPTVGATDWDREDARGRPLPGDTIISWDGLPALEAVETTGNLIPQSTRRSTLEFAARFLAFEPAWAPLRSGLHEVKIRFRRVDGSEGEARLAWKKGAPKLTNNGLPSLEEIPEDAFSAQEALYYYTREIAGRKVAVIHPRDFNSWSAPDLDLLLAMAGRDKAEVLVIDLKDSAGGEFLPVQIFLKALGIDERLSFDIRMRDPASGKIVEDVEFHPALGQDESCANSWKGEVILRTNSVAGSACDFFAFAFRRAGRGSIIGEATAGRGVGSDTLRLPHSGASIEIPKRDRAFTGPGGRVEGRGVEVDYFGEAELPALLEAFWNPRLRTHKDS